MWKTWLFNNPVPPHHVIECTLCLWPFETTSVQRNSPDYTANIYSQITVGFATQPKSVLSTVKLQPMAVKTTVIDLEDYSYSLSDVFGYNMCSKITVGFATQLKAVPSTVKIFAV